MTVRRPGILFLRTRARRPSRGPATLRAGVAAAVATWAAASGCHRADPAPGGAGAEAEGPASTLSLSRTAAGGGVTLHSTLPLHPFEEPRVATVGFDSATLALAVERAGALPRLHNMIVARHGRVEVERHLRGPGLDAPANVKSVSKSLLSALVGIAIEEGYLQGLDQPIAPTFTDYLGAEADPVRSAITLGHLLSMRSGLQSTSSRNYGAWVTSPNWVRHALTRPMVSGPGERMVYSTGNTHLVSALLTRATGVSTHAFARERLADPLGIRLPAWPTDPQGIHFGGNDMRVSPRDLLRFGELYRGGGTLEERRILSREWVEESWREHARSPRNGNVYGLGWWGRDSNGHAVRFAWGYGGQFLFVVPALELTVVFTSDPVSRREGPHNRALHALLDDLLVPAALAGAGAVGAAAGPGPEVGPPGS